jgi:hypothetical protein
MFGEIGQGGVDKEWSSSRAEEGVNDVSVLAYAMRLLNFYILLVLNQYTYNATWSTQQKQRLRRP